MGEEQLEGIILKTGEKVRLSIGEMTEEERRMLVLGGMINYYRSIRVVRQACCDSFFQRVEREIPSCLAVFSRLP